MRAFIATGKHVTHGYRINNADSWMDLGQRKIDNQKKKKKEKEDRNVLVSMTFEKEWIRLYEFLHIDQFYWDFLVLVIFF